MWRVPFEPGELKAVSRKNGTTVLQKRIRTAGAPARIELIADRTTIKADGKDLSFITARIVDKDGNLVPDADTKIVFGTTGAGTIAATDNGYQADLTPFTSKERKCWKGMALAIVRGTEKQGNITLKATATGLPPTTIVLKSAK
jgi:beta-galactosidase